MLNKRQNAIEGKLRVQDRASEILQDQIIEELKELVHTKTEEALQTAVKEHDLWMYKNEKEEAIRLQGVRKLRKMRKWLGRTGKRQERWKMASGGWSWRKKEAEVPEIIIVSDAVEGISVDLDGGSRHEQVEAKLSRR